jgi:HlyD family secretion protein
MKKWMIYTAIGAALLSAVLGYAIYANYAASQAKIEMEKRQAAAPPTPKFVTALGRIEPQGEVVKLTAPSGVSGAIVTELKVAEGEQVASGQTVALLDGFEQAMATVNEAKARVQIEKRKLDQIRAGAKSGDLAAQNAQTGRLEAELATARRERLRAENSGTDAPIAEYAAIERLERELANALTELGRSEKLVASGDTSRSERDTRRLNVETLEKEIKRARAALQTVVREKRLAVETLEKDLERARAAYSSLAEVRPTDVAAAQAEIENAEAAVEKAIADLEQRKVKTYTSGKVLKIYARPGETVGNDGVLELGDTETMFAVAEVFEADITRVKTGQTAEIIVRTSGEKFGGTIVQIGSQIRKRDVLDSDPVADVDARVVEVKVKLSPDASRQLADLTNLRVDVRISVD